MINLLPPDLKDTYRYGRHNRTLSHWITATVLCVAGGVAITAGGDLYLNHAVNNTSQQIATTNIQLQSENQSSVEKQVSDISNNLKLADQVLSKEILFSKLLRQLAAVTPSGVSLTTISISQTTGGLEITAMATSYNAATQLQVNLADPKNQIFSQADIESINCNGSTGNSDYPCSVNIRTLFGSNNPYLFVNSGKAGS